jgi:hypothetical protein
MALKIIFKGESSLYQTGRSYLLVDYFEPLSWTTVLLSSNIALIL